MNVSWKNVRAFDTLAPWIVPVVLVLAWEAAAQSGLLSARLLPAPSAIAVAGWAQPLRAVTLAPVRPGGDAGSLPSILVGLRYALGIMW